MKQKFVPACMFFSLALGFYSQVSIAETDTAQTFSELMDLLQLDSLRDSEGSIEGADVYLRIISVSETIEDKSIVAAAYANLAATYGSHDNYEVEEALLKQSLTIYTALDHKVGMASQYGNLGSAYSQQGHFGAAETAIKKSIALYKELDDKEGLARQYANLGRLHAKHENKSEAKKYWLMALDFYRQAGTQLNPNYVQLWLDELESENGGG